MQPRWDMHLEVARRDGKWLVGEGFTPRWNQAIHTIDMRDVKLTNEHLTGTMVVTPNPDSWVPGDRKPRTIHCELDATVRPGMVEGIYKAGGDTAATACTTSRRTSST